MRGREAGTRSGNKRKRRSRQVDYAFVFPEASEGWAWAHAHFNSEFSAQVVESDATKAAQAAQQVIDRAPDAACSRILCPRKPAKDRLSRNPDSSIRERAAGGLGRDQTVFDDP
jgi:hypothetical protein